MTCFAVLLLALIVLFTGVGLAIGLISIAAALIIMAVVAALAFLIWFWRIIYPWLVRIGIWAAQTRNTIFLLALLIGAFVLWYLLRLNVVLYAVLMPLGAIFVFLLLLAVPVWLVRLLRRWWPTFRDLYWDLGFRAGALPVKILLGIPLGITWFLYRPPLRWLIGALLFYLRGLAAGAAWVLYNPPLRNMRAVGLFAARLIVRLVALVLYNPIVRAFVLASVSVAVILGAERPEIPIQIGIITFFALLWPISAHLFVLRLLARFLSAIVYGVASWWPVRGVRKSLETGLTVESKSYQDYQYA